MMGGLNVQKSHGFLSLAMFIYEKFHQCSVQVEKP